MTTKAQKLFKTLVLGGITLASSTSLGACGGDGPREGPDGGPPLDSSLREGLDVGPPPRDMGIREGVDVGPPLDAAADPDAASPEDAGSTDDAPASSG